MLYVLVVESLLLVRSLVVRALRSRLRSRLWTRLRTCLRSAHALVHLAHKLVDLLGVAVDVGEVLALDSLLE